MFVIDARAIGYNVYWTNIPLHRCLKCAGSTAKRAEQQRVRTTKMLMAVVTVFAVTWTPFHIHSVIAEFRHDLMLGRFFKLGDVLCRVLAFSSACVNPVLYGWMNDHYRAAFVALVTRRRAAKAAVGRAGARLGSIPAEFSGGEKSRGHRILRESDNGNVEAIQLTPLTMTKSSSSRQ